jgi:hypothetical protein
MVYNNRVFTCKVCGYEYHDKSKKRYSKTRHYVCPIGCWSSTDRIGNEIYVTGDETIYRRWKDGENIWTGVRGEKDDDD